MLFTHIISRYLVKYNYDLHCPQFVIPLIASSWMKVQIQKKTAPLIQRGDTELPEQEGMLYFAVGGREGYRREVTSTKQGRYLLHIQCLPRKCKVM